MELVVTISDQAKFVPLKEDDVKLAVASLRRLHSSQFRDEIEISAVRDAITELEKKGNSYPVSKLSRVKHFLPENLKALIEQTESYQPREVIEYITLSIEDCEILRTEIKAAYPFWGELLSLVDNYQPGMNNGAEWYNEEYFDLKVWPHKELWATLLEHAARIGPKAQEFFDLAINAKETLALKAAGFTEEDRHFWGKLIGRCGFEPRLLGILERPDDPTQPGYHSVHFKIGVSDKEEVWMVPYFDEPYRTS